MTSEIIIQGKRIGQGEPCFIVAEMSANHAMSFTRAVEILHAAREAGADAVKMQTYTPDTITLDVRDARFRIQKGPWEGRYLHDLYREAFMPWEWQPKLMEEAGRIGIPLFSTPFDESAVEFLERLRVPAYKIASFEAVDLPLIRRTAQTGKPVILSTGMCSLGEIHEAVKEIENAGNRHIVLLKCTSAYPAPPEEMNLRTIPHLAEAFGHPVGLSDHSLGWEAAVTAVALGACLVEKHLTISRREEGPDSSFSLEPEEFRQMVRAVRTAQRAIGEVRYEPTEREAESRRFRRSLFVVRDVLPGKAFTRDNVRSIRPADGLHPRYLTQVIGRTAAREIARGTPLSWDLIGGKSEDSPGGTTGSGL